MNILRRDGIALAHTESGSGTPPLVFVHGWTCDHTFFAPQVAHFSRSHRVVVVDLRGHGASDAPRQDYTVVGFADDLAWQCAQLGIARPVIVGHSMGGTIALEIAARYPELAAAIVLIDSVILPPPAFVDALRPLGEALRGPCYRQALDQAAAPLFLPTDDAARKARLLARMSLTPQHVAASAFANHLIEYDAVAAAAGCTVPALYIGAAATKADLVRFRAACPRLITGQTVGSGHFSPLEVPEQINAMIERFLAVAVPRRPPSASAACRSKFEERRNCERELRRETHDHQLAPHDRRPGPVFL
jgi:pimeloyl-ACP methyl ester carboxylesterase